MLKSLPILAAVATIVGVFIGLYNACGPPKTQSARPNQFTTNTGDIYVANGDIVLGYSPEEHQQILREAVRELHSTLDDRIDARIAELLGTSPTGDLRILTDVVIAFGLDNRDASPREITNFLRDKARELNALRDRFSSFITADERIKTMLYRAGSALDDGDFDEADRILAEAEELQQSDRTLEEVHRQVELRTFRADAALVRDDVRAAAEHFAVAVEYLMPFDTDEGARLRYESANRLVEYSGRGRVGGEASELAIELHRENLSYWTYEEYPTDWATTHNSIGVALSHSGARHNNTLLHDAVAAYRKALTVFIRADHSAQWADTQNNLGNVLASQGEQTHGEEGDRLLEAATIAFQSALEVYNYEAYPVEWARTQMNLGTVLWRQAERQGREDGLKTFDAATEAFQASLAVFSRDAQPVEWARTQNNLGAVLWRRALGRDGKERTDLLAAAVDALQLALTVFSRERDPVEWAGTQNNLGSVFWSYARVHGRDARAEFLDEALTAYREAQTVYSRNSHAVMWSIAENNIGNVLMSQAEGYSGDASARILKEAIVAYSAALEVRTPDAHSLEWSMTQNNLCDALVAIGDLEHLDRSERRDYYLDARLCTRRVAEFFYPAGVGTPVPPQLQRAAITWQQITDRLGVLRDAR